MTTTEILRIPVPEVIEENRCWAFSSKKSVRVIAEGDEFGVDVLGPQGWSGVAVLDDKHMSFVFAAEISKGRSKEEVLDHLNEWLG